jgi:hypothetical protein
MPRHWPSGALPTGAPWNTAACFTLPLAWFSLYIFTISYAFRLQDILNEVLMSRLLLVPSVLCAAVLLAACQTTKPNQRPSQSPTASSTQTAQPQTAAPAVDFRLAQTQQAKNLVEVKLGKQSIWVLPAPVLTRSDLSGVGPVKDKKGAAFVRFAFNPAGAQKLAAVSKQNVGKLLVLSVNGSLVAVPRIGAPVTEGILNIPAGSEQRAVAITNAIVGPNAAKAK